MGKPKTSPEQEQPAPEQEQPAVDPLASQAGRAWLAGELARAEHEEAHGPGGGGWHHNEGLRPEIVERAAFLRALVALLK